MRYFWAGLFGLGIACAVIVSAALVVRYLPAGNDSVAVSAPPRAQQTAETAPERPAESSPAQTDRIAASDSADATASLPASSGKPAASTSRNAAEGEQIVAEFVPTIPPPVPPTEPLEIVPGGVLNFRSLPPEAIAQERPAESAAELAVAAAGRAGSRLRLTPEQAEKVRDVLLSHTIMQSEHEFPIRVGGTVPQNIELTPLPREVANAVPGYTNYSYVFTQNQLVIVVTTSRQIDLLIPA